MFVSQRVEPPLRSRQRRRFRLSQVLKPGRPNSLESERSSRSLRGSMLCVFSFPPVYPTSFPRSFFFPPDGFTRDDTSPRPPSILQNAPRGVSRVVLVIDGRGSEVVQVVVIAAEASTPPATSTPPTSRRIRAAAAGVSAAYPRSGWADAESHGADDNGPPPFIRASAFELSRVCSCPVVQHTP